MLKKNRLVARPCLEVLESRAVLSAITPAQLTGAYGLDAVNYQVGSGSVKGDGTGQTIAIIAVNHDANLSTELGIFDAQYGLANPALAVTNLAGSTTSSGWALEEALDVEWAHAAAPGANLVVIEATSTNVADLVAAINVARDTAGVSVVSMSFGTPEFSSEASYDSLFTTPAGHTGITYLASSGDSGAGVQWPASSSNVVAVGGTTLALDASGNRVGESAWAGSGGGASQYEPEPSYQTSVQASGHRSSPDVALDADPGDRRVGLLGQRGRMDHGGRDQPGEPGLGRPDRRGRPGPHHDRPGDARRGDPDPAGPLRRSRRFVQRHHHRVAGHGRL